MIREYYPEYSDIQHYPAANTVVINKVLEQWGILGNFADTPLTVDGVVFPSGEHLFQILKLSDTDLRRRTLAAPRGLAMKHVVNAKVNADCVRPDWSQHIVDALRFVLQTKYEQSADFREQLLRTKDFYIVEKAHGRIFDSYSAMLIGDEWIGPNLLG